MSSELTATDRVNLELTATDRVNLIEQMERQDANRRRKTVFAAWASVGLATLVLALLVFGAGEQLRKIRAEQKEAAETLANIRKETSKVTAELKKTAEKLAVTKQLLGNIAATPEGKKVFEEQISDDPNAARLLPRAYLQIVEEGDRDRAKEIGRRLEESGIIVPGVELVRTPAKFETTEVRYYKKAKAEDTKVEADGADRVVSLLKAAGVDAVPKGLPDRPSVRPNHFEVWFVAGFQNTK